MLEVRRGPQHGFKLGVTLCTLSVLSCCISYCAVLGCWVQQVLEAVSENDILPGSKPEAAGAVEGSFSFPCRAGFVCVVPLKTCVLTVTSVTAVGTPQASHQQQSPQAFALLL